MILSPPEIQQSVSQAQAAFPLFSRWEHINEVDEFHSGFSLWGELVFDESAASPSTYFVTFDTQGENWRGHLSVGQPCYFWSSADCGDAILLDTEACTELEGAMALLKLRIEKLFQAFLGTVF
ncbi:MAG: hypothetical protein ACYC61_01110 [Isosphaeraceae bacterium]